MPVLQVSELYNRHLDYRAAIPVLLAWLPRMQNPDVRAQIVTALGVRWARRLAAPALVQEFRREELSSSDRWRVANALAKVATDEVLPEILKLVRERRYGAEREMLAVALGNMRDPAALEELIRLLSDAEVAGHAIIGLRKLGRAEAAAAIRPLLSHPTAWIRAEARKALAKLQPKVSPESNPPGGASPPISGSTR